MQPAAVAAKVAEAVEATAVAKPTKASHGQMNMFHEQGHHRHHALNMLVQWRKPPKISPLLLVGVHQSLLPASSSGNGKIVVRAREEEGARAGALTTSIQALPESKRAH
jgi:hypothetical protein